MSPKHLNVIKTHIRMHVFAILREETRNIKQRDKGVAHTDKIRLPRGISPLRSDCSIPSSAADWCKNVNTYIQSLDVS